MIDFHRPQPYRLVRLVLLTLLTTGTLAMLWEFKLESWVMEYLELPYDSDFESAERWRFVLTSTGFSLLSLIIPTVVLKRLINNMRSSYRRMQRMQSQTETLAKYDSLTGLINRRVFMDQLEGHLSQGQPAAVMLIDLDRFKAINDCHGHSAGDSALVEVAGRLGQVAAEHGGIAGRLGGDEFCLLITGHLDDAQLSRIAQAVITRMSTPMLDNVETSYLGATVGISRSWVDATDASTLLHYADIAMYRGKNTGRSTWNFYDIAYERQRQAEFEHDCALREAIEREAIVPFFQPIVSLPSQAIVGFEILARWVRRDGSVVMPLDFIPSLERLGLIPAMTRSLVRQACAASRGWGAHLHLSLNVSAAMITDELFPDRLLEQLRQEGFPFDRFEVEITEEALVGNLAAAQRNLSRLHDHGVTVALDDFGTGYSGLYHLTRLSIDKIKIDRSFFEAGQTDHLPMVEAILGMARSLKMKVTAEGIEAFHLPHLPSWLASNGCDFAQGYLYGRPQAGLETAIAFPVSGTVKGMLAGDPA
jgi:diguanylate cyclase (GGDEF)-like protein